MANSSISEEMFNEIRTSINPEGFYSSMPDISGGNHNTTSTQEETFIPINGSQTHIIPLEVYIKKKNYKKNDFFENHKMYFQKRIKPLERHKKYELYYLEPLLKEITKKENQEFNLTNSNNYLPKAWCCKKEQSQDTPYNLKAFLYYGMKIGDTMYCTYLDEHYGLHKRHFYIPSNN